MSPKERLVRLEDRVERMRDVVLGLGERRLEVRHAMQRAAGVAQRLERPSKALGDDTALREARRLAAEAEDAYKRFDVEWSHESERLGDAQQLAARCRAYAEEHDLVARERGMRRSVGGVA